MPNPQDTAYSLDTARRPDVATVINASKKVTDAEWLARIEASGEVVYIGRNNSYAKPSRKKSKWHNPYKVGRDGTAEECAAKYRNDLLNNPSLLAQVEELRGKYLLCWCKPGICHGDVLVEILESRK